MEQKRKSDQYNWILLLPLARAVGRVCAVRVHRVLWTLFSFDCWLFLSIAFMHRKTVNRFPFGICDVWIQTNESRLCSVLICADVHNRFTLIKMYISLSLIVRRRCVWNRTEKELSVRVRHRICLIGYCRKKWTTCRRRGRDVGKGGRSGVNGNGSHWSGAFVCFCQMNFTDDRWNTCSGPQCAKLKGHRVFLSARTERRRGERRRAEGAVDVVVIHYHTLQNKLKFSWMKRASATSEPLSATFFSSFASNGIHTCERHNSGVRAACPQRAPQALPLHSRNEVLAFM